MPNVSAPRRASIRPSVYSTSVPPGGSAAWVTGHSASSNTPSSGPATSGSSGWHASAVSRIGGGCPAGANAIAPLGSMSM